MYHTNAIVDSHTPTFIIPTLNEEKHLGTTLASILHASTYFRDFEILVIDNGSTDQTIDIAYASGATVIQLQNANIGTLRNVGATRAKGDLLVFLDGDVELHPSWGQHVGHVLTKMAKEKHILVGSRVRPPENGTMIERFWFAKIKPSQRHLGAAHMLVRRDFFLGLGGFDGSLETGEDAELCNRVIHNGGDILIVESLKVTHHGFPKDIWSFFRRELWHGKNDVTTGRLRLPKSRVSWTGLTFLISAIASILLLLLGKPLPAAIISMPLLVIILTLTIIRHDADGIFDFLFVCFLNTIYLSARGLAVFGVYTHRPNLR